MLVTHLNHIGEVSEETEIRVKKLRKLGVQFFNQTVLLRKVNDDPDILAATFEKLHSLGLRPYYLFQARPVKGTLHFQVPLRRGLEIVLVLPGGIKLSTILSVRSVEKLKQSPLYCLRL